MVKAIYEKQKISFNYFKLINGTISALTNNLAAAILKGNPPDILIDISRNSCGVFDFFKAEELVEIGRFAAQKKLDSLKK